MRSAYLKKEMINHVLYALTKPNRLACEIALRTGLRIDDVLSIKSVQLRQKSFTVIEQKTGKRKRVYLTDSLRKELLEIAGEIYVFEHRRDKNRHRTRQAVWWDLKRAAKAFRVRVNITPHSMRKVYAVELYRRNGDLKKVQHALNHDSLEITLIYALADVLSEKNKAT